MHVIKVGFNHEIAPLDVREKITFLNDDIKLAMLDLKENYNMLENVIISTCNRTEIFAVVAQSHLGIASVQQFLIDWFQLDEADILPYLQNLKDKEVMEHLFRLVTGLDSMVIGETQILGQVKEAFLTAQKMETTGTLFNELFKRAITFAKRAHKDTVVSEQAVSISYVAVELAKKIFGDIKRKHVVILGAGEMGELALKNLQGSGVSKITVINRTLEKAERLAQKFNANVVHMGQLLHILQDADILISSTGAEEEVLHQQSLQPVQEMRHGNPLFIIDIAVPRDIDPSVKDLDGIFLYDIDDLHGVVDKNMEARKKAAAMIENQLVDEICAFTNWVAMLDAVPVIKALREKSLTIHERTLNSVYRKMPDLTEREKKVLHKHTKSIIHQLLEEPINKAKQLGENSESDESLRLFKEIFGLDVSEETHCWKRRNYVTTRQCEGNLTHS